MRSCPHGTRVRREGTNKFGKPYVGWFCPAPRGPDQCKPEFEDLRGPGGSKPLTNLELKVNTILQIVERIEKRLGQDKLNDIYGNTCTTGYGNTCTSDAGEIDAADVPF